MAPISGNWRELTGCSGDEAILEFPWRGTRCARRLAADERGCDAISPTKVTKPTYRRPSWRLPRWDNLIQKCLRAARDEHLDDFRDIIYGALAVAGADDRLSRLIRDLVQEERAIRRDASSEIAILARALDCSIHSRVAR